MRRVAFEVKDLKARIIDYFPVKFIRRIERQLTARNGERQVLHSFGAKIFVGRNFQFFGSEIGAIEGYACFGYAGNDKAHFRSAAADRCHLADGIDG